MLQHLHIIHILAAYVRKWESDMVTAPIWKWASTERQRFCVLHLVSYRGSATAFIPNRCIGRCSRQNRQCQRRFTWQWASTECQQSINRAATERQQTVNNLGCCILYHSKAVLRHLPIINVLATFVCKSESDMVTAPIWKWASTERQRFGVLHLVSPRGCSTAVIHNRSIGRLSRQYG